MNWIRNRSLLLAVGPILCRSFPVLYQTQRQQLATRTLPPLFGRGQGKMPKGVKKENLPSKICVVCNRPFTWRKKWESCWDEVTTCSKSCNGARRSLKAAGKKAAKYENAELPSSGSDDDSDHSNDGVGRGSSGGGGGGGGCGIGVGASEDDAKKAARKTAKKVAKAATRAKREGRAPPEAGRKPCVLCTHGVDLLVRCQTDASQEWRLVCGPCWKKVSGGVVDGDAAHPHYRYGGLWKNRVVKAKPEREAAAAAAAAVEATTTTMAAETAAAAASVEADGALEVELLASAVLPSSLLMAAES